MIPEIRGISAASMDDPGRLELMADIWTASAQPWDELSPTLPQFETTPTPEELQELATH